MPPFIYRPLNLTVLLIQHLSKTRFWFNMNFRKIVKKRKIKLIPLRIDLEREEWTAALVWIWSLQMFSLNISRWDLFRNLFFCFNSYKKSPVMHKSVNYTSWNDMFVMLLCTTDWKCFFNMLFENVSFFSFKNKKETSKKWVNQTTWCVDSIGSIASYRI